MILAMNLFDTKSANIDHLQKMGASDDDITNFYSNYRPLGACSDYIFQEIKEHTDNDINVILNQYVDIVKVPISESRGTLTGKYAAKDKIYVNFVFFNQFACFFGFHFPFFSQRDIFPTCEFIF